MKIFIIVIGLFVLTPFQIFAQLPGVQFVNPDTPVNIDFTTKNNYNALLDSCIFLNHKAQPIALAVVKQKHSSNQTFFYVIIFLFLLFGLIKTLFNKYFNTLLLVFKNTQFKQNQLTDQLLQAKLPSLIFNCLFVITTGFYIDALFQFFLPQTEIQHYKYIILSSLTVAVCYIVKYFALDFIRWLTNSNQEIKTYSFIVFLLNKILGIFFLFVLPIILFTNRLIASYAVLFSLIGVGLILLLRFFRSYSILQAQLKVSGFHFFLYVFSLELLPLAILFKFGVLFFATKS